MLDPLIPPSALVQTLHPLSSSLHLKTFPLHAHEILISWASYHVIGSTVAPIVSKWLFPESYPSWSAKTRLNWNARLVSLIQSSFISSVALYVILNDRERKDTDWKGRIWGYTGAQGMVQGFAAGYFLWDIVVSVRYLEIFGPGSLVHALSAFCITMLGFVSHSLLSEVLKGLIFWKRPFGIFYGLNFILYSLSTPFLSIHWLLDKLNMTGSMAQLVNGIALLSTFFCSRIVWGTYQSFLSYRDVWTALHSIAVGTSDLLQYADTGAEKLLSLPTWLVVVYLGSNTILNLLNVYWFGKMVQTVRKRFQSKEKKA